MAMQDIRYGIAGSGYPYSRVQLVVFRAKTFHTNAPPAQI